MSDEFDRELLLLRNTRPHGQYEAIFRYMIYRLYDKALKKPSFAPVMDTITPFAILHMLIFFVVAGLFYTFVIHAALLLLEHMGLLIIFVIFNLWVHHIIFYDQNTWNNIMEEFKDESQAERRKEGGVWLGILLVVPCCV